MAKHTKPVVRVHIGTIPEQYAELLKHLNALPVAARRWQLLDLATAGLQVRQSAFPHPWREVVARKGRQWMSMGSSTNGRKIEGLVNAMDKKYRD